MLISNIPNNSRENGRASFISPRRVPALGCIRLMDFKHLAFPFFIFWLSESYFTQRRTFYQQCFENIKDLDNHIMLKGKSSREQKTKTTSKARKGCKSRFDQTEWSKCKWYRCSPRVKWAALLSITSRHFTRYASELLSCVMIHTSFAFTFMFILLIF